MEREMIEELMTYRDQNDKEDWRSSPLIKNHPVEAVYALRCGCDQAIWAEMELDGEDFKLHFFNHHNDYHSSFPYGRQEELTHCPRCEVKLTFQDKDLMLDEGKVRVLGREMTLKGSRRLRVVLETFNALYIRGKLPT